MNNLSGERLLLMLTTALGPHLGGLMGDETIVEIMLNPDGAVWIDRLGAGRSNTGVVMNPADGQRVIELVASGTGAVCNAENPILSAELPGSGARFQGLLPPVVQRPSFTIRKKALMVFTLEDYVAQGIMTPDQRAAIVQAVNDKCNILVAGSTGSGKTTLVNAVLAEISKTGDRIVLIEDTLELQCTSPDTVPLRSNEKNTMNELLKATMRLRPDRIVVGEVRGGEALTLLKAWNTGHPGGAATVHANSARGALIRLEQLIQEAVANVPRVLVAEAVNIVIFIARTASGREIKEIARVVGVEGDEYQLETII